MALPRDSTAEHWTRPLKAGGVEFFMRLNGQTMKGSAGSHATHRDLAAMFEQSAGGTLPPPAEKPMRGQRAAWDAQQERADG